MSADTVGGVFSYALELAHGLCAQGVDVALATMGEPLSDAQRAALTGVPGLVVFESEFALEWMHEPWSSVDAAGKWLLRIAERFEPDIVHLNGYSHATLPWRAKTVVVAHSSVVGWWRAVRGGDPPRTFAEYRVRVQNGLSAADLVVAPSAAMLSELHDCYRVEPRSRVIHNGISRPASRIGNRRPLYLAAGRLWDEAKNLQLVAQVAGELPWPTMVAGEPPAATEEHEDLQFVGRVSRERVLFLMASASVFLHPARYEPFGLAPLEAAACEMPLVLGDIASLREIWGDAASYVPPQDAAALLRVARSLALDREQRVELGRRARARSARYSTERMVRQYLTAYRDLVSDQVALPEACAAEASARAPRLQEAW